MLKKLLARSLLYPVLATWTLAATTHCGGTPPQGEVNDLSNKTSLIATVALEKIGGCEGIPVVLEREGQVITTTTNEGGELTITDLGIGMYHFKIEVTGFTRYEQDLVLVNPRVPRDLGTIELQWLRQEMAGEVTTSDGSSPEGATVEVETQMEVTLPAGVQCGREGSNITTIFERKRAEVERGGSWRTRIPPGRETRGVVRKPGYTEEEFTITQPVSGPLPPTLPIPAPRVTLYPLTGFINIVGGTIQNQQTLTLQVSAFNGASEMALGEEVNGTCLSGSWIPYQATPQFTLTDLQGWHTLCVRIRNPRGQEITLTEEVFLDTLPPQGIVQIVHREERIPQETVTLHLFANDTGSGVGEMRIANSLTSLTSAPIIPFDWFKLWTLATVPHGEEAARTVYVQFRDLAGNFSPIVSDTIIVDKLPPTGSISPITSTLTNPVVTVILTHSPDAESMRLSVNNDCAGSSFIPATTSANILLANEGVHIIEAIFRDSAGNLSPCYQATVTYDATPPDSPNLQLHDLDNDGFALSSTTAELLWTLPVGATQFFLERQILGADPDFLLLATFANPTTSYKDTTLMPGKTHRYRIRARDGVGNLSAYSPVVEAYPFVPVTSVVWLREMNAENESGFRFFFNQPPGSLNLTAIYKYESIGGNMVVESQTFNAASLFIADKGATSPTRFNETLVIEATNRDQSLIYQSHFLLPFDTRQILTRGSYQLGGIAAVRDFSGKIHGVVVRDYKLWYFTGITPESYTWIELDPGNYVSNQASITVDTFGVPHIPYIRNDGSRLMYTTLSGNNWVTEEVRVLHPSNYSPNPRIVFHPTDGIYLFYKDYSSPTTLFASRRISPNSWITDAIYTSANSFWYMNYAVTLDKDQNLHLAIGDYPNLLYNKKPSGGSWGTLETVSLNVEPDVDIASTPLGEPWIAAIKITYGSPTTSELQLWYKTPAWTMRSLNIRQDPCIHQNPSLGVMGPSNDPKALVSYHIYCTKDLYFLYSTPSQGSYSFPLDISGDAGWENHLVIDPRGWALVFYDDRDINALKLTRFSVLGDGVYWEATSQTVDNSNYPGPYNLIGLDTQGNPLGVYFTYAWSDPCGGTQRLCFAAPGISSTWTIEPVATGIIDLSPGLLPRLITQPDGSIHFVFVQSQSLKYAQKYSGTWTVYDLGKNDVKSYGQSYQLTQDNSGSFHLVYLNTSNALSYTTWNPGPGVLPTVWQELDTGVNSAALAAHPLGDTIYTAYFKSYPDGIYIRKKEGATWTPALLVDGNISDARGIFLAPTPSGEIFLLYSGSDSNSESLYIAQGTTGPFTINMVEYSPLNYYMGGGIGPDGAFSFLYTQGTTLRHGRFEKGELFLSTLNTFPIGSFSSAMDPRGVTHLFLFDTLNYDLRYLSGILSGRILSREVRQR